MCLIRPANERDIEAISSIYNEAVRTTTATFDIVEKTLDEQMEWFRGHDKDHPVLVAEVEGIVEGWASLSRFDKRRAYDATAENSVYIRERARGRGIGGSLLGGLITAGETTRLRTVLARIVAGNDASLRLHERHGFEHVGLLRKVGFKFDQWLDVHIMQRMLNEG